MDGYHLCVKVLVCGTRDWYHKNLDLNLNMLSVCMADEKGIMMTLGGWMDRWMDGWMDGWMDVGVGFLMYLLVLLFDN